MFTESTDSICCSLPRKTHFSGSFKKALSYFEYSRLPLGLKIFISLLIFKLQSGTKSQRCCWKKKEKLKYVACKVCEPSEDWAPCISLWPPCLPVVLESVNLLLEDFLALSPRRFNTCSHHVSHSLSLCSLWHLFRQTRNANHCHWDLSGWKRCHHHSSKRNAASI